MTRINRDSSIRSRKIEKGKSPFEPGSVAASIDYAVTKKIRQMYTGLFGMKFDPLANEKKPSPSTQNNPAQTLMTMATSSHVKNISKDMRKVKGILTEMSKTLTDIKNKIQEGSESGVLDSIRDLFAGKNSMNRTGSIIIPRNASMQTTMSNTNANQGFMNSRSSIDFGSGIRQFMNPAVRELEAIRKKLESENTIAVKFSKTSDSAKTLSEIAQNTAEIPDLVSDDTSTNVAPENNKTKPSPTNIPNIPKQANRQGQMEMEGWTIGVPQDEDDKRPSTSTIPNLIPTPKASAIPIQPAVPSEDAVVPVPKASEAPTNRADRVGGKRGKDHIGYGHRLTEEELRTGKIKLPDGTELDVNKGITKEEAEKLYESDKSKLNDLTRKSLKNKGVDLDSLPPHVQEVIKDMGFNGPGVFNKNPKIIEALKSGDMEALSEAVRGSMHTADGKVLGGLVKRANERADAILDPSKKLDTKKFEGLETELYDPLVPMSKRKKESKAIPINQNRDLEKITQDNLKIKPAETAQIDPTQRQTGPVLDAMETQLAGAKDEKATQSGAPTIINNTTNNSGGGGGNKPTGPVANIRNDESSLVRMQNMIAAGAMS